MFGNIPVKARPTANAKPSSLQEHRCDEGSLPDREKMNGKNGQPV
jgi:hypothetical protein